MARADDDRRLSDQLAEALGLGQDDSCCQAKVIADPRRDEAEAVYRPYGSNTRALRGCFALLMVTVLIDLRFGVLLVAIALAVAALTDLAARTNPPPRQAWPEEFTQLRAYRTHLELRSGGICRRLEWSDVTAASDPADENWWPPAYRLTVAGHTCWLEHQGPGVRIRTAARAAMAYHRQQRRLAESVPENALSPAEQPRDDEDRGLSRVDA